MLVVVGLNNTATLQSNLLSHELTQPIDHCALHLRFGAAWIDDLATDVAACPKVFDLWCIVWRDGDFGHVCEVTLEAVVTCDTHRGSFREIALAPTRLLSNKLQDTAHALHIVSLWPGTCGSGTRLVFDFGLSGFCDEFLPGLSEQVEPELEGVLTRCVGQLVNEGLHDECVNICARCSQRAGLQPQRHDRRVHGEVWNKA